MFRNLTLALIGFALIVGSSEAAITTLSPEMAGQSSPDTNLTSAATGNMNDMHEIARRGGHSKKGHHKNKNKNKKKGGSRQSQRRNAERRHHHHRGQHQQSPKKSGRTGSV